MAYCEKHREKFECPSCRTEYEESDRPDEFDSTRDKGRRNELEAIKILSRAYNAAEAKANNMGHDFLGIVDVIATHRSRGMKFVQVKTNTLPGRNDRYRYAFKAAKCLPIGSLADFEIWVRKDREGWDLYRLNRDFDPSKDSFREKEPADQFYKYAEISICDTNRAGNAFRHGILGLPISRYAEPDYDPDDWRKVSEL